MPRERLHVTLDRDLAERILGEVEAGRFKSVDGYLDEAAARMLDDASDLEDWLRTSVVAGHQEYLADPTSTIPASDIMQRLRSARGSH